MYECQCWQYHQSCPSEATLRDKAATPGGSYGTIKIIIIIIIIIQPMPMLKLESACGLHPDCIVKMQMDCSSIPVLLDFSMFSYSLAFNLYDSDDCIGNGHTATSSTLSHKCTPSVLMKER
jgi:hypothetical protein